MSCDVSLGAFIERHCLGELGRCGGALRGSRFDRVSALVANLAALSGLFARFRQAHSIERAQAHVSLFSVPRGEAEYPALGNVTGVVGGDLQIEAATVGIQLNAGRTVSAPSRLGVFHFCW